MLSMCLHIDSSDAGKESTHQMCWLVHMVDRRVWLNCKCGKSLQVLQQLQDQFSDYSDMNQAMFNEINRQLRLIYASCNRISFPTPLYRKLRQKRLPHTTAMRQRVVNQIAHMVQKDNQIRICREVQGKALSAEDVEYLREQDHRLVFRQSLLLQQVEQDISTMLINEVASEILNVDQTLEAQKCSVLRHAGSPHEMLAGGAPASEDISTSAGVPALLTAESAESVRGSDCHVALTASLGCSPASAEAEWDTWQLHASAPGQVDEAAKDAPGDSACGRWQCALAEQLSVHHEVSESSSAHIVSASCGAGALPLSVTHADKEESDSILPSSQSPESAEEVESVAADSSQHGALSNNSAASSSYSSQSSESCSEGQEDDVVAHTLVPAPVTIAPTPAPVIADASQGDEIVRGQPSMHASEEDDEDSTHSHHDHVLRMSQEASQIMENLVIEDSCVLEATGAIRKQPGYVEDDDGLIRSWSLEQADPGEDVIVDASDISLDWGINSEDIFTVDELRSGAAEAPAELETQPWDCQDGALQVRLLYT